ncbi:MAG TPA: carboxypeptidase regulatory-like domain-containing protein [Acidobacteriota bacterium]|nr:carboxypeptidase regulatory-like domain-containing protein [Acidobacteriota bacterium]
MKKFTFACLMLAFVFFAGQVFAQTSFNTGSIYGKVFGTDGKPLPGVTVTCETEGAAPKTAFTGDAGSYRFAGLVPGSYSVTFALQTFTEVRQEDVKITAGQTVNLEVTLKQATSEQVVVSGEAPIVDTKKTTTSSSFSQDYLKNVPTARDPWVILDQTPGVDVDRINVGGNQSGQQSIYTAKGGSFVSNGWSYDGVDITDPAAQGATPTYYDFDSFQEIQITTGGQDPAVGTGGVVINFVTKRGGNSWAGSASGYFDNDSLQSNNVDSALIAQHFVAANQADQNWELGGDLGGPLVKDKAWLWGAYRYQHIANFTSTQVVHDSAAALNGTLAGHALQFIKLTDVNAKGNVSYNSENEGSYQYLYGNKDFLHRFALPPNQQSEETTWQQHGPSHLFKFEHTFIPNPNWFMDAKYAYIKNNFNLDPISGIGADAQPIFRLHGDSFLENGYVFYHTTRPQSNVTLDTNYFKQNWGGDHEFKFGFAYKHATVTTSSQYGGDIILYDFAGARGDQSAGAGVAKMRYLINALYNIDNLGVYGGDTWRTGRLTMNLGVRFEHSTAKAKAADAPANAVAPDLLPALHFGGDNNIPAFNNISPRLGATYDLTGDGKTVIRGNYARFYDPIGPVEPNFVNPLGAPGYTGIYTYYADLNGDGTITRNEIDTSYLGPFRGMVPGDANATAAGFLDHRFINADLKAQTTDEYLVGFERQLSTDLSVGATYTHRKYGNLEDAYIPGVVSSDFVCSPLTVTNPVSGQTFNTSFCDVTGANARDQFELLTVNGRDRTYDGVEFTFNKRMSNHWMARFTGTVQDQKIHFANNSTTFGGSFQDPTDIPFTNDTWWAEQSTGSGSGGVFTGSRWSIKLSGAYQFAHDITVGGYFKSIDGNVVPIIVRHGQAYSALFNGAFDYPLLQAFDAVRLPTINYMDVKFDKGFVLGAGGRLNVGVDIFNLFNTNTTVRVSRRAETFQFLEPNEIVAPRIVRLGLRYTF